MKYHLLKYTNVIGEAASKLMPETELREWLNGLPNMPQSDDYNSGKTGQELIDDDIVSTFEVTKSFADQYDKYGLVDLSTCDIFEEYMPADDISNYTRSSNSYLNAALMGDDYDDDNN
jgi:hypothetical protein